MAQSKSFLFGLKKTLGIILGVIGVITVVSGSVWILITGDIQGELVLVLIVGSFLCVIGLRLAGLKAVLIASSKVAIVSASTIACVLSMVWSYCTILAMTGWGVLTFLPALVFGFIATLVSTIVMN